VEHGATNFDTIFKYILDTMLQLCAPIRDPAIKKIYQMEKPVQKIKAILNQLDNMKIDLANYNIKKFRPYLKEIAVNYERSKFKEAIESNFIDLEYTEKWLSHSVIRIVKNHSTTKLTKDLKKKTNDNQMKYVDICNDAFLSLLFKREIINNEKTFMKSENIKKNDNYNTGMEEGRRSPSKLKNSNGIEDGRRSPSKIKNSNGIEDGRRSPNKMNNNYNGMEDGRRSPNKMNNNYNGMEDGRRSPNKMNNNYIVMENGRRSPNKMNNNYNGMEDGRCSPSKMRNSNGMEDGRRTPSKMKNNSNGNSHGQSIKEDEIVLPETLMFDYHRIMEYQQMIRNIAIVSSITILCQSIVPYLHGKEFIIKNVYVELLDYIENNLQQHLQKTPHKKEVGTTSSSGNDENMKMNSSSSTMTIADTKNESSGVEDGKKKNKMDKESKMSSLVADFAKYIITKIESVILDSILEYNKVITNFVKLEPKILSANEKVLLKKMIINTLLLNNNMYNIISRQIMSLLLHYMKTGDFKSETLDRFCLQYSKERLQEIFIKIKVFTEYNRDVYSEYYDKIISKLLIINKFYPSKK